MRTKIVQLLAAMLYTTLLLSCSNEDSIKATYLIEGKIAEMTIPLSIIKNETELNSSNIGHIKCSVLDSTMYVNNNPDEKVVFSTPVAINFTKPIEKYSVEYYAIYTVHCIDEAIKYYNGLFDDLINFDSQKEYKSIEITLGDVPYLTTPNLFIFERGANPSPSVFYHELGHRAFWYLEDNIGIQFNGLTYIHMGLLEYFTVSLNDSPVIGEDALPKKVIRNASWLYSYPPSDTLSLGHTLEALKESYPNDIHNPKSNISKMYNAYIHTYKDYLDIIDNHSEGMIITSTLWRIRKHLGKENMDNLVVKTILKLNHFMEQRPIFYNDEKKSPKRIEWYDLYYGLIQNNRDMYNGKNEQIFIDEFRKTGFPVEAVKFN